MESEAVENLKWICPLAEPSEEPLMRVILVQGDSEMTQRVRDLLGRAHDVVVAHRPTPDVDGADIVVMVWPTQPQGRDGAARLVTSLGHGRCVVVVPFGLTADRLGIVDAGVDYIVDPYHPLELVRRVEFLGEGIRTRRAPVWRAGDLTLDEGARIVERGGRPIDLTRKEFDLLRQLVRNCGLVQERSVLLDAVWSSRDYNENVIEVTMSSLRQKLEARGPRILHTVRGVGYVCRVEQERAEVLSNLVSERDSLIQDRQRLMAHRRELMEEARARRSGGSRAGRTDDR